MNRVVEVTDAKSKYYFWETVETWTEQTARGKIDGDSEQLEMGKVGTWLPQSAKLSTFDCNKGVGSY